jgi:hypothetical protein
LLNPTVPSPVVPSTGVVEVEGDPFLMDEGPFKQVELSRVCGVHALPVEGSLVLSVDGCSVLSIEGSSE